MRIQMAPNITLAIVLLAAVAAVAFRAVARRPEPRWVPGTEPRPAAVTADPSRAQPVVTIGVEQMQDVFHELHANGRHALCTVCEGQYASA